MVMIGCDSARTARSIKRSGVCSLNLFGAEAMGLFSTPERYRGDKLRDMGWLRATMTAFRPRWLPDEPAMPCPGATDATAPTRTPLQAPGAWSTLRSSMIAAASRYEDLHTVEYVGDAQARLPLLLGPGWAFWNVRAFLQSLSSLATPRTNNKGRGPTQVPGLVC